MNSYDFLQILLVLGLVTALTPALGSYMAFVFRGDKTLLLRFLRPLEKTIYRLCSVDPKQEMGWKQYAWALVTFNVIGLLALFGIQFAQGALPLNPQNLAAPSWHLALNAAVSFVTNTNWQSYAGETTMSYFTQMIGLSVQNFVSAGCGIAALLALTRGIASREASNLGNFWADLTRGCLYILLPLSIVLAVLLMSQGVVQSFEAYVSAVTVEGAKQVIPLGPAASQIAIKQLGTNGGGFFNANSAHPFENPTAFSNLLQLIALILIPAALTHTYGVLVNNKKQGWVLFCAMMALLVGFLAVSLHYEYSAYGPLLAGPILEGKETRFGVTNSVLWSVLTTAASNGSVNAMHSSLSPISGGIAMLNIMLGEIVFGGVGSGMYGMILFVLLTVFLAGLMVGRTPEYLGKKIEAAEMRWAVFAVIAPSAVILIGAGVTCLLPTGLSSLANHGPHGLSEILYAFASAAGNNGSAFAGLNANTTYYNVALAICMLVGRFAVLVPCIAIGGSFARKKLVPASSGTFSTESPLFVALLISVIIIVGALTFFPALTLGPIVEHFLMKQGRLF